MNGPKKKFWRLTPDELRAARTYISMPSLCNVATSNDWIEGLLYEIEQSKAELVAAERMIARMREASCGCLGGLGRDY